MKDKIPEQHREMVETYEAKAKDLHETHVQPLQRKVMKTSKEGWVRAKDLHVTHLQPLQGKVAETSKEGCAACHGFWTHPDTKEAGCNIVKGIVACFAGCLHAIATFAEGSSHGNRPQAQVALVEDAILAPNAEKEEEKRQQDLPEIINEQAMDASYIHVDRTRSIPP